MKELPLDWSGLRTTYFTELTRSEHLDRMIQPLSYQVRPMRLQDVPVIMELANTIDEFRGNAKAEEMLRHSLEKGESRGYWIESEGRAVSMVRTSAENPYAAMIVGVGTHVDFRRQGLATQLMARLCCEVLYEGKKLCLFYDNPRAGKIYKRLGFRDIGMWSMVKVNKTRE
ncbi:GNAT family N-acetyltransferase [Paludifilum halophilum]|uniref:N-acetyltransferase domain-containing protein n=1 Tax=Paludifilum halophilum TaxID=1642702 RepID=A0A235B8R8_9BACL|nr:GNAT family N-acetyltransferase [Paludifilum halophilum]OYD08267.1 hypothetical protein CHM34_05290 [Paludifilum halophilum]